MGSFHLYKYFTMCALLISPHNLGDDLVKLIGGQRLFKHFIMFALVISPHYLEDDLVELKDVQQCSIKHFYVYGGHLNTQR